jgi:hypothetical protein
MTWTTPKTWVTGEPLTASDLNTHLKDNLNALKEPPTDHYECDEASDYSTTSTSFVDVDATNLALTITTSGGDILVGFSGDIANDTAGRSVMLNISLDGTLVTNDDGFIVTYQTTANRSIPVSFVYLITGVSAGAHTLKLSWKVSANTGVLYAGSGTASADIHPQFWAREVS